MAANQTNVAPSQDRRVRRTRSALTRAAIALVSERGTTAVPISDLPYADVFLRLCDVHPDGRSYNVCDGLVSLTGADPRQAPGRRPLPPH